VAEGKQILKAATDRHEACARGEEGKIALNMETAQLLRRLSVGLEPLFRANKNAAPETNKSPQDTWVMFPD
jgi:hypothetical protein